MHILITGGADSIGAALEHQLLDGGDTKLPYSGVD